MARRRVRRSKDRKIFRVTSNKTQSINIRPVMMRGGIRL